MKIRLVPYGILRDAIGASEIIIEINCEPCRVRELRNFLLRKFPSFREYIVGSVLVKGDKLLSEEYEIRDGDELVILPPGSGG